MREDGAPKEGERGARERPKSLNLLMERNLIPQTRTPAPERLQDQGHASAGRGRHPQARRPPRIVTGTCGKPCTPHPSFYTLHHTIHPSLFTLHSTPYTLHPSLYTTPISLLSTPYTLHHITHPSLCTLLPISLHSTLCGKGTAPPSKAAAGQPSLLLSLTHMHSLSFSRFLYLAFALSHTHTLSFSVPLPLTLAHAHTHTHTHTKQGGIVTGAG